MATRPGEECRHPHDAATEKLARSLVWAKNEIGILVLTPKRDFVPVVPTPPGDVPAPPCALPPPDGGCVVAQPRWPKAGRALDTSCERNKNRGRVVGYMVPLRLAHYGMPYARVFLKVQLVHMARMGLYRKTFVFYRFVGRFLLLRGFQMEKRRRKGAEGEGGGERRKVREKQQTACRRLKILIRLSSDHCPISWYSMYRLLGCGPRIPDF